MELTLQQKLAAGMVPTPADYAGASGEPNIGNMLQGTGATINQGSFPPAAVPSTQPAPVVTTGGGSDSGGGGSAANPYMAAMLSTKVLNGKSYDMKTSDGQMAFYNDSAKFQLDQHDQALGEMRKNLNVARQQAQSQYDSGLSGLKRNYDSINNGAQKYANQYLTNAQNLDNSHGTNLAQIGANYQAASPGVLQSSQAYDTDFANNQYSQGKQAMMKDLHATVGDNYINLGNDGNVSYGDLSNAGGSTYGDQYINNNQAIGDLTKSYNFAGTDAQNKEAQDEQKLNLGYNANRDALGNNLYQIDAYAGLKGFQAPTNNYQSPNLNPVDISKFTQSPISNAAPVGDAASGAYFSPPGAPSQTAKQEYLGFAPGSTQYGGLKNFLTAAGSS